MFSIGGNLHYLVFVAVLSPTVVLGGNGTPKGPIDPALQSKTTGWMKNRNTLRFLENKGQMADLDNKPVKGLLFEASGGGVDMYVADWGISYVFTQEVKEKIKEKEQRAMDNKLPQQDSTTIKYCRADMELVGADIKKENIIKEYESEDRVDYYLPQCPDGVMNVHSYQKITIKNIYPGIDWILTASPQSSPKEMKVTGGLKYDFIVHPGADPSVIKLRYKWTDKPILQSDGSIKISIPFGDIVEGAPVSYVEDQNKVKDKVKNKENRIHTSYAVEDDEISFTVGRYDKSKTLIIDPALIWGTTYYGVTSAEEVRSMHCDGTNVWVTGIIDGPSTFPTLNPLGGAYFQAALGANGAFNAFIMQFDTAGVLKWVTYYGGEYVDAGNSIYSDGTYVWVTGYTVANNQYLFPTYDPGGGAYMQPPTNGAYFYMAFILKFTTGGIRQWATVYGCNLWGGANRSYGGTYGNSIQSDGKNVWVTGNTSVSPYLPTQAGGPGSYNQPSPITGYPSAFILKFNIAGVRQWATYYAGFWNSGNSIFSDGTNVWLTGYANDYYGPNNLPLKNPGGLAYYQTTCCLTNLYYNVFIAKFSTSGILKWGTYYPGNYVDVANSIYSNGRNVWVTGYASSTNFATLPGPPGSYNQPALGGKKDAFILQFDTACVRQWATYYGGTSDDIGYSISADTSHNVWVSGATKSTDFPTLNPGCGSWFQSTLGGISLSHEDGFILQFDTTGKRKWATYYGYDSQDDGSVVSSDGKDLFISGSAASRSTYPVQNPGHGAFYQNNIPTTNSLNVFMGKFCLNCVQKMTISPPDSICPGDSVRITAGGEQTYTWTPASGLSSDTIASPYASPSVTTTYIVIGSSGVGCTDTDTVSIFVRPAPHPLVTGTDTICAGKSTVLMASGGGNYSWNTGSSASSVTVSPSSTSTYSVFVSAGSCTVSAAYTVKVDSCGFPSVTVIGKTSCAGICDTVTAVAYGGTAPYTYLWNPSGQTDSSIVVCPFLSTIYSVTITDSTNATATTTVMVTISPSPSVTVSPPATICAGNSSTLSASGGGTYSWTTGATTSSVTLTPSATASYTVTVTNAGGCTDTASVMVTISPPPVAAITGKDTICSGNGTILTASGGGNYVWNTAATTSSISAVPTVTSTYSVLVSVGTCEDSASYTVTVQPDPIATAASNVIINIGEHTTLTATGGGTYSWVPSTGLSCSNCSNPVASPEQTRDYCVFVTDAAGCTDSACVTVTVETHCDPVYIPNAFSPNGDGENDMLYVYGNCIKELKLVIYDRWGERVFEYSGPPMNTGQGWDGRYASASLSTGDNKSENTAVFDYYLTYTLITGTEGHKKGNVSLIR